MVVDLNAVAQGSGYARSYKDGVTDPRVTPDISFVGKWYSGSGDFFVAEKINFKKLDENDKTQGVSVDDVQFNADVKFQNEMDQTIMYSLSVQRSTGRFTERYREDSKQVPFAENAGRCVFFQSPHRN
jgi:hypothetical protein